MGRTRQREKHGSLMSQRAQICARLRHALTPIDLGSSSFVPLPSSARYPGTSLDCGGCSSSSSFMYGAANTLHSSGFGEHMKPRRVKVATVAQVTHTASTPLPPRPLLTHQEHCACVSLCAQTMSQRAHGINHDPSTTPRNALRGWREQKVRKQLGPYLTVLGSGVPDTDARVA